MKKIGFALSICVILCLDCLVCRTALATLVVEPALIKMDLKQDRNSGTFVIKNVGDTEERYRAKSVHFTLSTQGSLQEIAADEFSLAPWIKFNPQEFVLPPNSSRIVRYSVIPQERLKNHEYWGAIEFMPLQGTKFSNVDEKGNGMKLQIMTVILVPLYGFVEGTPYTGDVKELAVKKEKDEVYAYCKIVNKGTGVLRLVGNCQITDSSAKVREDIPLKGLVIFPKTERLLRIKLSKDTPPGNYLARVKLQSHDKHFKIDMSREAKFDL